MSTVSHSYVVTGGAQGIGRVVACRLASDGFVVVIDTCTQLGWEHDMVHHIAGDASDPSVAKQAADLAQSKGDLVGWVNNAAVFQDAQLNTATAAEVLRLINLNFSMALVGCHTAINHFLAHKTRGAIVNMSSHQAQRPVRGALPYATAKAAVEGLTRAAAVDHGHAGIRVNALALGSIDTERYQELRLQDPGTESKIAAVHPLGRIGTCDEVAEAVACLLSDKMSFVTGIVLPLDGGRSILGIDPEEITV